MFMGDACTVIARLARRSGKLSAGSAAFRFSLDATCEAGAVREGPVIEADPLRDDRRALLPFVFFRAVSC